ncbi:hypothetical protein [Rufibacter quisquiliarum]|uniref:Uncharacterized protein n=1 Tax=Rufibacter quisquiliarum TaxID=1549639 RepID=A0A839GIL6_9BACT|nr:hypothetical protein [Rufibacter quisquiliarum]MBA9075455.1 hypothetical protein [Rufibacter quisquiliarum]
MLGLEKNTAVFALIWEKQARNTQQAITVDTKTPAGLLKGPQQALAHKKALHFLQNR